MTFRLFTFTASVARLATVSGKSSYSSTGNSYKGYLNALQIAEVGAERYGKEYRFTTVVGADIIESDKLTIDGVTYKVSEVIKNQNIFNVKVLVCSLTKT